MDQEARTILASELRKNDRAATSADGRIVGTIQSYVITVLPQDLLATIRAVALSELNEQVHIGNKPSQIIVDNLPVSKKGIMAARRSVRIRFQDTRTMITAVNDLWRLLMQITRIQAPPKNAIVARNEFYLWLDGANLGKMPAAMSKIMGEGVLTQKSVVRIVGPLVNYGRKVFWNPVGANKTMAFNRYKSKRFGVRFSPLRGASLTAPRFVPYKDRTLRRKANRTSAPALALAAMMSGATPPGRVENTGQIVKRIMRRNPLYKGLHIADGWVEYPPAIGWSKLSDPRVPSYSVQFARRGAMPLLGNYGGEQ